MILWSKTYSPKVIDQEVEDAQDNDKHDGAELGLESNNHHHASHESQKSHNNSPDAPGSAEDESDEEEDQENSTSKLKVHLAVLLVDFWETCKCLGLAHPRVGEDHQKTAHDGQVSQEEVQVENETVSKCLCDNNPNETSNCVVRVLSGNDQ